MDKRLTKEHYDNPIITVVWESDSEEFSKERKNRVKEYFKKKYKTKHVNIITKANRSGESDLVVDVSSDITDVNLQYDLIRTILQNKGQMKYYEPVLDIDKAVESRMVEKNIEVSHFKKWYIKKIRFSNFLSFGDNQEIDYDEYNGLTVVESNPANTGGKSVLSVDLLLYLFFNTTTKSSKAEDIFNKYTDSNRVFVQGEIQIDGNDYVITRTIKRELNKSGSYSVSSSLDINRLLPNGQMFNETGEQRRETEQFIKNSIGTMEDFLMTIMTTASNLEELLESKPTSRGMILSRFLGLEHIKKKEEVAKEIYNAFSKTMQSNIYNVEQVKEATKQLNRENYEFEDLEVKKRAVLSDLEERLQKGEQYKDGLLDKKHSDIDSELLKIRPEELDSEIKKQKLETNRLEEELKSIVLTVPTMLYDEEAHDKVKDSLMDYRVKEGQLKSKIKELNDLKTAFGNGLSCEHCGIKIMEAKLTKEKIDSIPAFESELSVVMANIEDLVNNEKTFVQAKKDFDEYEKTKLIIEKTKVFLESSNIKLGQLEDKMSRYLAEQDKIKKNNEIDSQVIKAKMRINELLGEKRTIENEISAITVKKQTNISKIQANEDIITKINEEFEVEKNYKMYLELFGKNGISKLIMKTMLPFINTELERLLEDSCYFKLEVRINDKNEVEFIMIDNNTGVEKLMSTGSGYERTISSLALRAVLSRVCSLPKPNIWIADEVFGKVANEYLDLLGNFLTKLTSYFDKILLISFNPLINNWANHIIKVEKIDNISRIVKH